MIILGVDPGSYSSGYARVEVSGGNGKPVRVKYLAAGNVPSRPSSLAPLLKGADIVGVEKIEGIAYPAKGPGIVGALVSSSYAAGMISGLACARGLRVIEMPARQWRSAVCGKANASDIRIKNIVTRLVEALPRQTNVHQRDALGLAVGVAWALGGDARQRRLVG